LRAKVPQHLRDRFEPYLVKGRRRRAAAAAS